MTRSHPAQRGHEGSRGLGAARSPGHHQSRRHPPGDVRLRRWDGDEIVAGHLADHLKLRNIRRDPRVTLSVEPDVPFEGFSPYLVITGIALSRKAERKRAPQHHDRQFPPPGDNFPAGFVTRTRRARSRAPAPGALPIERPTAATGQLADRATSSDGSGLA